MRLKEERLIEAEEKELSDKQLCCENWCQSVRFLPPPFHLFVRHKTAARCVTQAPGFNNGHSQFGGKTTLPASLLLRTCGLRANRGRRLASRGRSHDLCLCGRHRAGLLLLLLMD